MRVVALYRVSTEKQANEGASLDAQQREYYTRAAQNGWTTVAEFRGCESATQAATERRVLQQVLACVREHAPDAVYVHEQSRLTRGDELEVALLMRELRERGLKIIVGGVIRDLGSIDERFMVGIQSLVDRAESERIKERMNRGKREKAKRGQKTSGPSPFGYTNPPSGTPGRGTLQVVPEEAAVVRRLFALSAAGKGDRAVATALNELGLRAPLGGTWGKTSVRRVLNNPAYLGTAASNIWMNKPGSRSFKLDLRNENAVLVENAHEAIIDRDTWDAVHGRVQLPRTQVPRMLSGVLWVNGRPYHGDSNRHSAFYRAARAVHGAPWLETSRTDAVVWEAFTSLATGPEFVEQIMAEALSPHERVVIPQEIEYLNEQISRQQRRMENLVEMRADGEIDKTTFQAKAEEARKAIETMTREVGDLQSRCLAADRTVAARIAKAVQVLLGGRTTLTVSQRRTLLGSIVRRVDLTVVPTGASQQRAKGGRLAASGGPRWAIERIAFRLALPAEEATAGGTPGDEAQLASRTHGDGQMVRDSCSCGQEPVTVKGRGDGELVTIL